ncbi:stage II sporulation protein D [Thermohalobacter berrensis]|uniref:Stage II sporulation protein D n=1 Tax=Thermohalobacter berrensis TaxID=99594 RepID=A0A419T1A1_9FIRM|nr:stage II sporulation protein D [Thermohalobacter berrensis]RKD31334.1 stage II sporulation protein D [Thermohalobacter berrensis]
MCQKGLNYIKVFSKRLGKVIEKTVEDIVKVMVKSDIPKDFSDYHIEFLKAQAIIERTNLIKRAKSFGGRGCSRHPECDICDTSHCISTINEDELKEVWKDSYKVNIDKVNKAVEDTQGLIITVNNRPIDAKFHHTCGGSTVNSENVINNKVIYLRKVLCDYCIDSPNWENYKEISIKEIEEKLNVKFPNINPMLKSNIKGFIEEVERDKDGRVLEIKIGDKKFKGTEVMELLDLDSTKFSMAPEVIRITAQGKGHGLGLCQYGANEMALKGNSYEDIINYYYTGVKISKVQKPCIEKPLSGRIIMIDPGHGGDECKDLVGVKGLREKDVVLKVGKKMKKYLQQLGATVYLTREKDEYVSLGKRAELANNMRPNFFISLHLNSFPNPSIHGCEIYYYRGDYDSEVLSKFIINNLEEKLGIVNRGTKTAELFLLREVGVSSLQIDLDYITNPEQEEKMKDDNYLDEMAKAIVSGIKDYFKY